MHQCSATRIDSHCDYDGLSGSAAPRSADRRLAVCRRYGFCRRKLKLVTFQTPLASQFASKYLATPVLWIRVTGSILVLDTQVTNSWEVAPPCHWLAYLRATPNVPQTFPINYSNKATR